MFFSVNRKYNKKPFLPLTTFPSDRLVLLFIRNAIAETGDHQKEKFARQLN